MKEIVKTMVEHPVATAFGLWAVSGALALVLSNIPTLITINVSKPMIKADA